MNVLISGKLTLINLFLWLILVYVYRSEYFRTTNRPGKYGLIGFIAILFSTFAFSEADTYHYEYIYDKMVLYNVRIHIEEFYFWLVQVLPQNYYIWRFAIWGSAALIYIKVCKVNKLDSRIVGLIFPLILIQQFAVTRGCLGITLFLLGASVFIKREKQNKALYIWSVFAIVASLFLHKSLPLFIAIAALAFIPLNKKTFIILLILFPILRGFVLPFVFDFIGSGFFDKETASFATSYLEKEKSEMNFNGMLRMILEYAPRFIIFYVLIKCFIYRKVLIPRNIRFFFNYSFVLFYIALLFLGQATSSFVTNRTIHMMCFTLLIPTVYYLQNTKRSRTEKNALLLFMCSDLFAFAYQIITCW